MCTRKKGVSYEQKSLDVTTFIEKTKHYTEIKELAPEIINEFIDKIVVHQKEKVNGKKYQQIDVYYNGIGIINVPVDEFEMENAFQEYIKTKKKTA